MGFCSETEKIRPRIIKYCNGHVLDIGCGSDKVCPEAIGLDCRDLPGVNMLTKDLNKISKSHPDFVGYFDCVYSSHCLEHFEDDIGAIRDWLRLLKIGGFLVLYLPDDLHYDNDSNPEHLHRYKLKEFVNEFMKQFEEIEVIEGGPDIGEDRYSFFVVAQKKSEEKERKSGKSKGKDFTAK